MTDQELDRIMRRVLIDSMKLEEDVEDNGPVFEPSLRHRRRMRAMLANPWAGCGDGSVRCGGRQCGGRRSFSSSAA